MHSFIFVALKIPQRCLWEDDDDVNVDREEVEDEISIGVEERCLICLGDFSEGEEGNQAPGERKNADSFDFFTMFSCFA